MTHVIIESGSANWLDPLSAPVHLIVGRADAAMAVDMLREESSDTVTLTQLDGGHDLPLSKTDACLALIQAS